MEKKADVVVFQRLGNDDLGIETTVIIRLWFHG
jgi:hypothetical protein